MADVDRYPSLMEILKQLHHEKAMFTGWNIQYEKIDGKLTGAFQITVTGKEQSDEIQS